MWMECRRATGTSGEVRQLSAVGKPWGHCVTLHLRLVRERPGTVTREARDVRERRDPKFEVLGSRFRKTRTSDLEPLPVPLVSPAPRPSPTRTGHRSSAVPKWFFRSLLDIHDDTNLDGLLRGNP